MSQVGFGSAASMKVVRLTIAALMAVCAIAVAMLSGPATASADGGVSNCSNISVNVVCVGQVNANPVTVNIGDVNVLSGNALSALTHNLNDVFVSVVNIQDVNILSADLTTLVQSTVNSVITTTKTCTAVVSPPAATTQSSTITISCT